MDKEQEKIANLIRRLELRIASIQQWPAALKDYKEILAILKSFPALLKAAKSVFDNSSYSSEGTEGEFYVFLHDMDALEAAINKAEAPK